MISQLFMVLSLSFLWNSLINWFLSGSLPIPYELTFGENWFWNVGLSIDYLLKITFDSGESGMSTWAIERNFDWPDDTMFL